MLKPMLFIGCGGSGLRTLRHLRRELEFRLSSAGIGREEFPDAWQFLVIDVPAEELLNDAELKSYAGNSYIGLADSECGYLFADGIDDQLSRREHSRRDFVQWRPNPDKTPVDVSKGAGQWRAVGRVVAGFSLNAKVGDRVASAIRSMSGDASEASLRNVATNWEYPERKLRQSISPWPSSFRRWGVVLDQESSSTSLIFCVAWRVESPGCRGV